MNTQVLPFNNQPCNKFLWSYKPILKFIQLFGIYLEPTKPRPTRFWKTLSNFHFLLCVLIVFAANSKILIDLVFKIRITPAVALELIHIMVFSSGIQLTYLISQKNKVAYWKLVDQIEIEFNFDVQVYRQLRNLSTASVVLIIFWVN